MIKEDTLPVRSKEQVRARRAVYHLLALRGRATEKAILRDAAPELRPLIAGALAELAAAERITVDGNHYRLNEPYRPYRLRR
ncbi:hypothetical protein [Nocardia cyriacigeorgica]|uniref:hypothetical protein n=1 Tax=Nocardia cyriacigeorgica TaxID=135487 RepID=UPI002453D8F8|nr:hypothetical protein [Nocardia cyriacigeorgica]